MTVADETREVEAGDAYIPSGKTTPWNEPVFNRSRARRRGPILIEDE